MSHTTYRTLIVLTDFRARCDLEYDSLVGSCTGDPGQDVEFEGPFCTSEKCGMLQRYRK